MSRMGTTRIDYIHHLLNMGYSRCPKCDGLGTIRDPETNAVADCDYCFAEGFVHPLHEELLKHITYPYQKTKL